ncbi:MAG: hypothetical protein Tsb009_04870 [Planctomycetaceae bacterium]
MSDTSSIPSENSVESATAPPEWFRRKQSRSESKPLPPAVPALPATSPGATPASRKQRIRIVTSEEPEPTWIEELADSLKGFLGLGFGTSLLVHIVLILILAFWILDFEEILPELLIDGSRDVGADVQLEPDINIALSNNKGGQQVEERTLIQPRDILPRKEIDATIPPDIASRVNEFAAKGKGKGTSDGDGTGNDSGSVPDGGPKKGSNAVTKGSFTVWTIPRDPAVRQNYLIVVRVRLPKTVKRLRISDLKGKVMGDKDKHLQYIPFDRNWGPAKIRNRRGGSPFINLRPDSYIPVSVYRRRKYAQIYIWVLGSDIPKTTDTIEVESKILKEKQTIKIVF